LLQNIKKAQENKVSWELCGRNYLLAYDDDGINVLGDNIDSKMQNYRNFN
jgi:uncharacterized protein YacL (UPF0231 family)